MLSLGNSANGRDDGAMNVAPLDLVVATATDCSRSRTATVLTQVPTRYHSMTSRQGRTCPSLAPCLASNQINVTPGLHKVKKRTRVGQQLGAGSNACWGCHAHAVCVHAWFQLHLCCPVLMCSFAVCSGSKGCVCPQPAAGAVQVQGACGAAAGETALTAALAVQLYCHPSFQTLEVALQYSTLSGWLCCMTAFKCHP
jgi:hypothetical protein